MLARAGLQFVDLAEGFDFLFDLLADLEGEGVLEAFEVIGDGVLDVGAEGGACSGDLPVGERSLEDPAWHGPGLGPLAGFGGAVLEGKGGQCEAEDRSDDQSDGARGHQCHAASPADHCAHARDDKGCRRRDGIDHLPVEVGHAGVLRELLQLDGLNFNALGGCGQTVPGEPSLDEVRHFGGQACGEGGHLGLDPCGEFGLVAGRRRPGRS